VAAVEATSASGIEESNSRIAFSAFTAITNGLAVSWRERRYLRDDSRMSQARESIAYYQRDIGREPLFTKLSFCLECVLTMTQ
jgi:hypothetical protein